MNFDEAKNTYFNKRNWRGYPFRMVICMIRFIITFMFSIRISFKFKESFVKEILWLVNAKS